VSKALAYAVQRRRAYAVVGSNAADVDLINLSLPQPGRQSLAVDCEALEGRVGGRVVALVEDGGEVTVGEVVMKLSAR
jgi:hypothetical protein